MQQVDDDVVRPQRVADALSDGEAEQLRRLGTAVMLQAKRGNVALAERMFRQAVAELHADGGESTPLLETTLLEAGVSERTANMLESSLGTLTIGELLGLAPEELFEVKGIELKSVAHILRALARFSVRRALVLEEDNAWLRARLKLAGVGGD